MAGKAAAAPPAVVPPARGGGSDGVGGPGRGFQTTQTGSNLCTFLSLNSLESHRFQHPLKQMFSLDSAPVSLCHLRSTQTSGWLGRALGPWRPAPAPRAPGRSRRQPRLGGCVAARGQRGLTPPAGEGGREAGRQGRGWGEETAAGALTVRRQRRVLCRASAGASPPPGRPGPGQLGRCKLGTGGKKRRGGGQCGGGAGRPGPPTGAGRGCAPLLPMPGPGTPARCHWCRGGWAGRWRVSPDSRSDFCSATFRWCDPRRSQGSSQHHCRRGQSIEDDAHGLGPWPEPDRL